jgi:6-pyruvoyltetrahydropterin/6-carboxytetrahydropterin synthase
MIMRKKEVNRITSEGYIQIDGWKTNIRFSAAHIIPEYEKCGRLHGHSYAIHAKLYGSKDEKGIIIDFSIIKKQLKEIADHLDHFILIPGLNESIQIVKEADKITITFHQKTYVFPRDDCIILPIHSTSAENLAQYVLETVLENLKISDHLNHIEIGVDEGYGQGAYVSKDF